ncbi:hypothetical protein [Nocardia neocaledoniensis]|uniref:hypothetical protein n=1 Tax=Nocardia neocaledoniensis TaxID=236511 RepID=UPI0024561D7E|nr:hypothetical protein [Nocardia neocaledoniensis]
MLIIGPRNWTKVAAAEWYGRRQGKAVSTIEGVADMGYAQTSTAEINYGDNVPDDVRGVIEKSVETLVGRAAERMEKQRALRSRHEEFRAAEKEHYRRQIEGDPESARAFDAARKRLSSVELNNGLADAEPLDAQLVRTAGMFKFGNATKIFWAPFHYTWHWSNHEGTYSLSDGMAVGSPGNNGYAGISAAVSTDVAWLDAHAGVGVAFTVADVNSSTPVFVMGRSLRWVRKEYSVLAAPGNGDATTEGGVELTVLEGGNLVTVASNKMWRERRSNGEIAQGGGLAEGFQLDPTLEVLWTMQPGRVYTMNLGVWTTVDCDDGIYGDSGAYGYIDSNIGALSLFK